jgi:hypothetical protein
VIRTSTNEPAFVERTFSMEDRDFVLIDSGIPGDRDALYFLQEKKHFFPF